jgi:anti-anti-sigma factor
MMEIEFERKGDVALFSLVGRIDSAGSAQLDTAIKSRMAPTDLSVLFDMARVSYMSSAGIRVFSMVERGLRQKNGHLYLCAVQPAVEKVLEITGFHRIFTLCATTGEALRRSDGTRVPGGKENAALFGTGDVRLSVEVLAQGEAVLKISGAGEHACTGVFDASDLISHTFVRDEYCAGIGAPGDSPEEAFLQLGGFVTMGGGIFSSRTMSRPASASRPRSRSRLTGISMRSSLRNPTTRRV